MCTLDKRMWTYQNPAGLWVISLIYSFSVDRCMPVRQFWERLLCVMRFILQSQFEFWMSSHLSQLSQCCNWEGYSCPTSPTLSPSSVKAICWPTRLDSSVVSVLFSPLFSAVLSPVSVMFVADIHSKVLIPLDGNSLRLRIMQVP